MELLRDFEETLSKVIENQEILNQISTKESFSLEKDALLKTQESLKAHLFFLTDIYSKERKHFKGSYQKKQIVIEKSNYLKRISNIKIEIPFESKIHLRKHRLKKTISL